MRTPTGKSRAARIFGGRPSVLKVHYQINPGGTFAVTACDLRVVSNHLDVRPIHAFDASLSHLRCKHCDRYRNKELNK